MMILYYFFGFIVAAVVLVYMLPSAPAANEHFLDSIRTISPTQIAAQNAILNNQQLADQKQKDKYIADYKQVVSTASAIEKQNEPTESAPAPKPKPKPEPKPEPAPTAYKDPKDMTAGELRRFKRMTIFDNMTVQDYKNWLMLYQKDYYLLNDENLLNLRNLLRGETLFLRNIPDGPTGGLPLDNTTNENMNNTQKYYARMYDQLARTDQILAPIHSAVGGGDGAGRARQEVGYNYNEYSEFAAPVAMPQLQVVNGQVENQYRRPRRTQEGKKVVTIPLEDVVAPFPVSPTM